MKIILNVLQGLKLGGMERGTLQLACRGRQAGFDCRLLLFDTPYARRDDEYDAREIPVSCMLRRPGIDWRFSIKLARCFREWGVELVHARNATAIFYSVCACLIMTGKRPKIMGTFHSLPTSDSWRTRVAVRWAVQHTEFVNTISKELACRLVQGGWVRRTPTTIWNGVDTSIFQPVGRSFGLRQRVGKKFLIGHIGRYDTNKRHRDLIEAVKTLQFDGWDIALAMVGTGTLVQSVKSQCHAMPDVHILGSIKDIAAFLRDIDVLALCSEHEGTPRCLLEAMACGCPVVATDVGGVADLLMPPADLQWILVPVAKPHLLAHSLLKLLRNREIRQRLAAHGLERIKQHYELAHEWAAYEGIYKKLLPQS